jgi:L-ascorbate metabolism protein UlaG (beta-lactamase superfamily)
MIENLHWLGHASFYLKSNNGTVVFFDPYHLKDGLPKADLILISHDHYDHCSGADVARVSKPGTVIIGPRPAAARLKLAVQALSPGMSVEARGVLVEAVASYNLDKPFHPMACGNLGFIAAVDGVRHYHAGDTDLIPEMKGVRAEVALLPVGGTYTMGPSEAAQAAGWIKPKIAVPMHYGTVVGSAADAERFKGLCPCEVAILRKE